MSLLFEKSLRIRTSMMAVVISALIASLFTPYVDAHAAWMAKTFCGRSMDVGSFVMGGYIFETDQRELYVYRNNDLLTSGSKYVPGETLHVHLSNYDKLPVDIYNWERHEYAFETTGATFLNGGCGGTRYAGPIGLLVMPKSGNVTLTAAFYDRGRGQSTARTNGTFLLVDPKGNIPNVPSTYAGTPTYPVDIGKSTFGAIFIGIVVFFIPVLLFYVYLSKTNSVPIDVSLKTKIMGFVTVAYATGVLSVILVGIWVRGGNTVYQTNYLGLPNYTFNEIAVHVSLMVGGFFFGQVVAISSWGIFLHVIPTDYDVVRKIHFFFQTCSAICLTVGLIVIVKYETGKGDLTSIHSWMGAMATTMFGITYLFGGYLPILLAKVTPDEQIIYKRLHRMAGMITFALIVTAISTGVMDRLYDGNCRYINSAVRNYPSLFKFPLDHYVTTPDACKIAYGMVVAIFISSLSVTGLVYTRSTTLALDIHLSDETKYTAYIYVFIGFAIALGTAAVILVAQWAQDRNQVGNNTQQGYLGLPSFADNPLAWHAALMVGGFFYGQVFAILAWSIVPALLPSSMDPKVKRQHAKNTHAFLQFASAACMVAALVAAVRYRYINKQLSLNTVHSWSGVIASSLFASTYILGGFMAALTQFYPDSPIHKALDLRYFHRFMGMASLGFICIAIATGVMDQLSTGSCFVLKDEPAANPADFQIPTSCKIAHGMVLSVIFAAICIGIAVVLRQKPSVNPHAPPGEGEKLMELPVKV